MGTTTTAARRDAAAADDGGVVLGLVLVGRRRAGGRLPGHDRAQVRVDDDRGQPKRVVTVGFSDQDALLALGVIPVGIRDWYGDQPSAVWPWATEALGDAKPEVLSSSELNFEQIRALDPDLIVGLTSGMTEVEYGTLAQIAPTVPQSDEYIEYGVPWQVVTTTIGTAVGKRGRGRGAGRRHQGAARRHRRRPPGLEGQGGGDRYV